MSEKPTEWYYHVDGELESIAIYLTALADELDIIPEGASFDPTTRLIRTTAGSVTHIRHLLKLAKQKREAILRLARLREIAPVPLDSEGVFVDVNPKR
jgi:hypothetical protein